MNLVLNDFKRLLCVYLWGVNIVYKMSTFYGNMSVFATVITKCLHLKAIRTEIVAITPLLNLHKSLGWNIVIHERSHFYFIFRISLLKQWMREKVQLVSLVSKSFQNCSMPFLPVWNDIWKCQSCRAKYICWLKPSWHTNIWNLASKDF